MRRISLTESEQPTSSAYRYVDERLGEFAIGGGIPYRYQGRYEKVD